jgi:drug/metabolite transporter (DMT)-like permease
MFTGGAALLVASIFSGDYCNLAGASLKSVIALLYLIALGSLFAYSAYVFLLRTQSPSRVAAHTFVNPIVAVALGWAFAGERVTPAVLLAACFVIGSVILTIYARPKMRGR